jgi:hypothetical protein
VCDNVTDVVLRLDKHWQEHPQVRCKMRVGDVYVSNSTVVFLNLETGGLVITSVVLRLHEHWQEHPQVRCTTHVGNVLCFRQHSCVPHIY